MAELDDFDDEESPDRPELDPRPASPSRETQPRALTWLAITGVVLVAMLVVSNVLLWQIADQDDAGTAAGTAAGTGDGDGDLLPPPTTGTSNRAAADELDDLTVDLEAQFRTLQATLNPLIAGVSGTNALPGGLADISGGLDSLSAQANSFGGLSTSIDSAAVSLDTIAGSTQLLSSASSQLNQINSTIAGVERNTRAVSELNGTNQGIAETNDAIGTTNGAIGQTNNAIQISNDRLSQVVDILGRLDTTMTSVDKQTEGLSQNSKDSLAQLGEMRILLQQMLVQTQNTNASLDTIIKIFCADSMNPPPECP